MKRKRNEHFFFAQDKPHEGRSKQAKRRRYCRAVLYPSAIFFSLPRAARLIVLSHSPWKFPERRSSSFPPSADLTRYLAIFYRLSYARSYCRCTVSGVLVRDLSFFSCVQLCKITDFHLCVPVCVCEYIYCVRRRYLE